MILPFAHHLTTSSNGPRRSRIEALHHEVGVCSFVRRGALFLRPGLPSRLPERAEPCQRRVSSTGATRRQSSALRRLSSMARSHHLTGEHAKACCAVGVGKPSQVCVSSSCGGPRFICIGTI